MRSSARHSDTHPPAIMDIEASGFGKESYPIEIGYIESDQSCFCNLITPQSDWTHWSLEAEKLHGIQRDTLFNNGLYPTQLAQSLNQQLEGKILYCDGWVLDYTWLLKLFSVTTLSPSFRLSPIEMIMNEQQIALWDTTKSKIIQQSHYQRHRASHDAYIIQKTWIETFCLSRLNST